MKKQGSKIAILLIISMFVLILGGCGGNKATSEAPKQGDSKEEIKPVELKVHHQDPPSGGIGLGFETWAQEVFEKTDGIVKITCYPSATLGPGPKGLELAQDGVADIAWASVGLYSGRFPLIEMTTSPLIGLISGEQASKVVWNYFLNSPEAQAEFEDPKVKLISIYTAGFTPMGLDTKIESVNDFKGKKIRVIGGGPAELMRRMGAEPVVIPPTEVYQQIERKVLNGWALDWGAAVPFKLTELSPYIYEAKNNLFTSTHLIIMNKDSYNKIPDQYKPVFDELCGEYLAAHMGKKFDDCIPQGLEQIQNAKHEYSYFNDETEAEMQRIANQIMNELAQKLDGQGLNGTKNLQLIKDIAKEFPETR